MFHQSFEQNTEPFDAFHLSWFLSCVILVILLFLHFYSPYVGLCDSDVIIAQEKSVSTGLQVNT